MANSMRDPSERVRDSSNLPRRREVSKMLRAGTHVPRMISQPASARHLAMAQPKPWSSATPAMKAFLPARRGRGRSGVSRGPMEGGLATPDCYSIATREKRL